MELTIIVVSVGIGIWAALVAVWGLESTEESGCGHNCNQGRQCVCQVPTSEQQLKHQLDDEFNNSNWPFPTTKP